MSADSQQIVAKALNFAHVLRDVGLRMAADLARAGRLRQAILKRTFAGRLVPQDPADEPAVGALEQIRRQSCPTTARPAKRAARQAKASFGEGAR